MYDFELPAMGFYTTKLWSHHKEGVEKCETVVDRLCTILSKTFF